MGSKILSIIKKNYLYFVGVLVGCIMSVILSFAWINYTEYSLGYLVTLTPSETAYACFALVGMAFIAYQVIIRIARFFIK